MRISKYVLVLDDELVPGAEPGVLPAGRNRSELLFEGLRKAGFNAVLYDGRGGFDGKKELRDVSEAAAELLDRLKKEWSVDDKYGVTTDVVLDLMWFEDESYGAELLRRINDSHIIRTRRVIVWSKIAGKKTQIDFAKEFEVPAEYVRDRAGANEQRIIQLLQQ